MADKTDFSKMDPNDLPEGVRIREIKRKNRDGSRYVERRFCKYNPKKGYEEILFTERIGKMDAGSDEVRPSRKQSRKTVGESQAVATRTRTGATDILNWAGRNSGLTKVVQNAFSGNDAAKLLSVAQFAVCTGDTVHNIEAWQVEHSVPYQKGLSEDICYDLFSKLGADESGMQCLFGQLAAKAGNKTPVLAFDSTTISTYSVNQTSARYGYNKDNDGLPTLKLVSFFSLDHGLPVSFELQPGNISDLSCVTNAITRAKSYGVGQVEVVLDNGFFSKSNICELCRKHTKFTIRATLKDSWIYRNLNPVTEQSTQVEPRRLLEKSSTMCPDDSSIHAISFAQMIDFEWARSRKRGAKDKGEIERDSFRLYLHYYRNTRIAEFERHVLESQVNTLRNEILAGKTSLSAAERLLLDRYLVQSRAGRGGKLKIEINDEAIDEACKDLGIFCLISSRRKDPWEALRFYRMRNQIESGYKISKNDLDGNKPRVWTEKSLRGKEVCRMIALGYHFYLQQAISDVRERAFKMSEDETLTGLERGRYAALFSWLKEKTLRQILQWFDCVQTVAVDNRAGRNRWTTESIARDRLFLQMLGVTE